MTDSIFEVFDRLVDRRTILVVIFTMVLCHLLLDLTIPITTSNPVDFFVSVVVLTGYLYFTRTALRFPIAIILSFSFSMSEELSPKSREEEIRETREIAGKVRRYIHGEKEPFRERLLRIGRNLLRYIQVLPIGLFKTAWFLVRFGRIRSSLYISGHRDFFVMFLLILDRLGLIAIAGLAAVPVLHPIVISFGMAGLSIMLIAFVFSGRFSAIIQDPLEKQEFEEASGQVVRNSTSRPLYVEIVNTKPVPVENKESTSPLYG